MVDPARNSPQFVLVDPDGSNEVMLSHHPLAGRYPTWSPDGTKILGMTLDDEGDGTDGILIVDVAQEADPLELLLGNVWGDPAWRRVAS